MPPFCAPMGEGVEGMKASVSCWVSSISTVSALTVKPSSPVCFSTMIC